MNWTDYLVTSLSAILFLLYAIWTTWRLEATWNAFVGMIEIVADATRF